MATMGPKRPKPKDRRKPPANRSSDYLQGWYARALASVETGMGSGEQEGRRAARTPDGAAMNSQDLWERCQYLAECLLREPNMLVPNLTEEEHEDVRDHIAEAIYKEQQSAYEQVYRWANGRLSDAYRELRESKKKDEPTYRNQRIGESDIAEKLMAFLRPMIAIDIDATLEYSEGAERMTTDTEHLREIARSLEKIDRKIRDYSLTIIFTLGFIAGCLIV